MSDPFLGEIKMFGGNYAPQGYALCDGSVLPVSNNEALFSLIGATYGGNGQTEFGLPDFRGRIPVHQGQGTGLSNRVLGTLGGAENVTLIAAQLPSHTHPMQGSSNAATSLDPNGNVFGVATANAYDQTPENPVSIAPASVSVEGGNQSHPNVMPFQCINFIIAILGEYPTRS